MLQASHREGGGNPVAQDLEWAGTSFILAVEARVAMDLDDPHQDLLEASRNGSDPMPGDAQRQNEPNLDGFLPDQDEKVRYGVDLAAGEDFGHHVVQQQVVQLSRRSPAGKSPNPCESLGVGVMTTVNIMKGGCDVVTTANIKKGGCDVETTMMGGSNRAVEEGLKLGCLLCAQTVCGNACSTKDMDLCLDQGPYYPLIPPTGLGGGGGLFCAGAVARYPFCWV